MQQDITTRTFPEFLPVVPADEPGHEDGMPPERMQGVRWEYRDRADGCSIRIECVRHAA